jgi:hypothetical protein
MSLRKTIGKTTHGILRSGWHRLEASPAAPLAWRVRLFPRVVRRTAGAGSVEPPWRSEARIDRRSA